jgi:hypothetical protein
MADIDSPHRAWIFGVSYEAPRASRVEHDVRDLKDMLAALKTMAARTDARLGAMEAKLSAMDARLDATRPHLATKADLVQLEVKLADKPGKTYMWVILAALLTAYACGLAALAVPK